jgi:hypothetical protein
MPKTLSEALKKTQKQQQTDHGSACDPANQ